MDKDILLLKLNEKWKCDLQFGWIPIASDEIIPNTEIYDSDYFEYYLDQIKEIIKNTLKVGSLFELREDGQFQKLNISECDFEYDGLEYIYTDKNLSFVLYFSHESSVTVGGKELLDYIHNIWPDYKSHFWDPRWS